MILLYMFIIFLLGYFSLFVCNKIGLLSKLNELEKIGFSILNGAFLFSIYELLLSIIGVKYNFSIFIPIIIISIVSVVILLRKISLYKFTKSRIFNNKIIIILLISLIIILTKYGLTAYCYNLMYPDEFSFWGLSAKNMFIGGKVNFFINSGLESYPIFIPLIYNGYYVFINEISEHSIRIIPTFIFIGFMFSFCGLTKKHNVKVEYVLIGFILTILLYSGFSTYAFSAYADVTFAVFFTLSIIYLLEWLVYNEKDGFILSIIFANCASWTKIDGLPMACINIALVILYLLVKRNRKKELDTKIDLKTFMIYSVSVLFMGVFWFAYKKLMNFPTNIDAGAGHQFEFNIQWLVSLLTNMSIQQFTDLIWSFFLVLFLSFAYKDFENYNYKKKIYIVFGILSVIASIVFLLLCYLVVFGGEAVIAASYIRYLTRAIFIFEYIVLLMIPNRKAGEIKDEKQ